MSHKDLSINKGVELMLRRRVTKEEPKRYGLKLIKNFSLLKKDFQIKFEFTWRDTIPTREK